MWYYIVKDPPNELYHHGIKGQKWGDKNGPPYPLGASSHSSSERKEGTSGWSNKAKKEYKASKKSSNRSEDNSEKKKSGLTDKQKKAIKIGAAVAVTILAAYGGYKIYQNREGIADYMSQFHMNKDVGKKTVDKLKDTDLFDKKINPAEDVIKKAHEAAWYTPGLKKKNVDDILNKIQQESTKKLTDTIIDESKLTSDVRAAMNAIKSDKEAADIFDYRQVAKLTDTEVKAIKDYTTPLYKEANLYLRSEDGYGSDVGKSIGNSMMSALNKVHISKDVNVQRGINETVARRILGESNLTQLNKLKREYGKDSPVIKLDTIRGKQNLDKGVMSTSVPFKLFNGDISSAADYYSGEYGIIFDIKAKAGSKGMYIAPITRMSGERELAFAPNSTLVTDGTAQLVKGIWHIGAYLVQ